MEESKNLEQNLDKSNEKLHISGVSVGLYTENEAKELAYKILYLSTPPAYAVFADRKTFEYRWNELINKKI